jgi:hypothetical protein
MGLLVKGPVEPSPRDVDVGSEEWVDGVDSEVAGCVGCSAFIVSGKVGWFGVVGGERRGPGVMREEMVVVDGQRRVILYAVARLIW